MKKTKHRRKQMNQVQYIACGFFAVILIGTFLLMLPVSTRSGQHTGFLEAMFTATSASCVTGLVVYDTYTHWSVFGQIVLLGLIQIGGLGFITIGVGFSMMFRRHIGLRQRDLLKESVNALEIGGILKLWRSIIAGTFLFEGIGALLLSIRFIPQFGFAKGVFFGVFHSISAFCNAGFDLMGKKQAYSSFVEYVDDPLVNLVLCSLIVIGSLGFVVWKDLWTNKFDWNKYSLHTKLVLTVTFGLIVFGTVLLYIFERNNTLVGMNASGKFLASLFGAITPRTAGFNTVDTGALTPESKMVTIILMFIGGSPGSTAGGIKTTTIAVMLIYVISNLRNESGCNVFHRRVCDEVIKKASNVFCLNLFLAMACSVILLATSSLAMDDVLFEVISAISTVGMTTGITRDLNLTGRIVIMILMYCGRIGSMTFALLFMQRPQQTLTYPAEKITIG